MDKKYLANLPVTNTLCDMLNNKVNNLTINVEDKKNKYIIQ